MLLVVTVLLLLLGPLRQANIEHEESYEFHPLLPCSYHVVVLAGPVVVPPCDDEAALFVGDAEHFDSIRTCFRRLVWCVNPIRLNRAAADSMSSSWASFSSNSGRGPLIVLEIWG